MSENEFIFRMARSNPELSELEWDPFLQEFKAKEGLFPTNQYLADGVSVYLNELLKSNGIDLSWTFDDALKPTNQNQFTAEIFNDPQEVCEAGKAHALIRPFVSDAFPSDIKTVKRVWKQIRQRLISRAIARPKDKLIWDSPN